MKLAVRLKPYEEEAFGGFIQRLAVSNGQTLHSLASHVLHPGRGQFKQADVVRLDYFPKNILSIKKLEELSEIGLSTVRQNSFWSLLNRFVEEEEISSTKIMRDMLRSNFAYCPQCIEENGYRKLLWSVRAISSCPEHNLRLTDVCSHCMKTIHLFHLRDCLACPYCNNHLGKGEERIPAIATNYEAFVWRSLTRMREESIMTLSAQQVALKLIYVLADCCDTYDYRQMKNQVSNISLEGLLQQARGSSRRRVHLLPILDLVFMKGLEIDDFLALEVPTSFSAQVLPEKNEKSKVVIKNNLRAKRIVNQPSRKYNRNIPEHVENLCEEMYQAKSKITIQEVSKRLSISDTSLRKWNIGLIIKRYKEMAIHRDYEEMKINWENGIHQFLDEEIGDILTGEIYAYLDVRPSLIRKVAPEIIDWLQQIRSEVRESNRRLRN